MFDGLFVHIFKGIQEQYKAEIEAVKNQYPFADFEYLPKTLRLEFPEAISMLREAGIQIGDHDDLSTESERVL